MFSDHISRHLRRILTLSVAALTLACSPSQQDEQQSPDSSAIDPSDTAASEQNRGPHQQTLAPVNQSISPESSPSAMHAADSAPFAILTPEMWEVKIARMAAEGNMEGAEVELHKLRVEFPEYTINPSLLEKLNRDYE
jgi:hypothetical protein